MRAILPSHCFSNVSCSRPWRSQRPFIGSAFETSSLGHYLRTPGAASGERAIPHLLEFVLRGACAIDWSHMFAHFVRLCWRTMQSDTTA